MSKREPFITVRFPIPDDYEELPCGCHMEINAFHAEMHLCPMHTAAPELLKICQDLADYRHGHLPDQLAASPDLWRSYLRKLDAAIESATEKPNQE